jgi:hypothetical protein
VICARLTRSQHEARPASVDQKETTVATMAEIKEHLTKLIEAKDGEYNESAIAGDYVLEYGMGDPTKVSPASLDALIEGRKK